MRILIAEDDAASRRLLEGILAKWGYDVVAVADGQQALQRLESPDGPNLAVLDWLMPGMDGPEVCRQVRARVNPEERYIYLLLLTGKTTTEDIVAGMEAGADDYIAKPFHPQELKVRIRAGQRIVELQEELIATREALRVQATHDPLTSLWNRRAIMDSLRREMARSVREKTPLSVAILDIDHFKLVNDTHGHQVGDEVLCEVTRRMTGAVRPFDSVGRYGGEEFLIVLHNCDAGEARGVAERVRMDISDSCCTSAAGPVLVTASVGVATARDVLVPDVDKLIQTADEALYQAKAAGRNRVIVIPGTD